MLGQGKVAQTWHIFKYWMFKIVGNEQPWYPRCHGWLAVFKRILCWLGNVVSISVMIYGLGQNTCYQCFHCQKVAEIKLSHWILAVVFHHYIYLCDSTIYQYHIHSDSCFWKCLYHLLGFQITVEHSRDRIFKDEEYARYKIDSQGIGKGSLIYKLCGYLLLWRVWFSSSLVWDRV